MDNCPFCKIIKGEIPAKKIYEDDSCTAVLDIYPANPGHVLLLSKAHHNSFLEIIEPDLVNIGVISKKIGENIIRAFKPDGLSIFIADGQAAGQRAPHFILHIIPRFDKDGIPFEAKRMDLEVDAVFKKLKPALMNLFPQMDYDKKVDKQDEYEEKTESELEKTKTKTEQTPTISLQEKTQKSRTQSPEKEKTHKKEEHKKHKDDDLTLDKIKQLFEKE